MQVLERIKAECSAPQRSDQCFHGAPLWCRNEPSVVGYYYTERQRAQRKDRCWDVQGERGGSGSKPVGGKLEANYLKQLVRLTFNQRAKCNLTWNHCINAASVPTKSYRMKKKSFNLIVLVPNQEPIECVGQREAQRKLLCGSDKGKQTLGGAENRYCPKER